MSKYKAVIFDLDGTLLNTIGDISSSINTVMTEIDKPSFSETEIKYFVGSGVNILIEKVIEARKLDKEMFQFVKARYLEIYRTNCLIKTAPYPGIVHLLENLEKANIALNVLSNKPDVDAISVTRHFFPQIKFTNILGKRKEFPIKPHPDSVEHIIKSLKLSKAEVLYVGDTSIDIETAKNSGLVSVGVLWGFRDLSDLQNAQADFIVAEPDEIFKLIRGN